MSISDLFCDLGLDTLGKMTDTDGKDTRGWRMIWVAAGPNNILRIHLEGKLLQLVQQDEPMLVYVNPSTDPDAFDVWQTPPDKGEGRWVGRPRADKNGTCASKSEGRQN